MGGCRCTYKTCQNSTKTTENVHFFHYPVKHPERCKIWIDNANKPHFYDLEEDQLKNKVICEYHFEDRWFPNLQKKRLLQGAVPTLDIGCEKEAVNTGIFVSTGMHEVPLLPASSDGSLFILDTECLFPKAPNIECYVYKDGKIIPNNELARTQQENKRKNTVSLNSRALINRFSPSNQAVSNQTSQNTTLTQNFLNHSIFSNALDDPLDTKVNIKTENPQHSSFGDTFNPDVKVPQYNSMEESVEHPINENNSFEYIHLEKSVTRNHVIGKHTPDKPNLAKNYLRKLNQHSRDIASIKKLLRQKSNPVVKPDMETILNVLKDKLPPSLLLLNRLHITNENELMQDDIEFLTTMQKASPELYQLLQDKYKWDLPIVDILVD